jgi:hypothetical protein
MSWITGQPDLLRLRESDLHLFDAATLSPTDRPDLWDLVKDLDPDKSVIRAVAGQLDETDLRVAWVLSPGRLSLVLASRMAEVAALGREMADFYGRHGWRLRIEKPEKGRRPVVVRLGGGAGCHRAVILEVKPSIIKASVGLCVKISIVCF